MSFQRFLGILYRNEYFIFFYFGSVSIAPNYHLKLLWYVSLANSSDSCRIWRCPTKFPNLKTVLCPSLMVPIIASLFTYRFKVIRPATFVRYDDSQGYPKGPQVPPICLQHKFWIFWLCPLSLSFLSEVIDQIWLYSILLSIVFGHFRQGS